MNTSEKKKISCSLCRFERHAPYDSDALSSWCAITKKSKNPYEVEEDIRSWLEEHGSHLDAGEVLPQILKAFPEEEMVKTSKKWLRQYSNQINREDVLAAILEIDPEDYDTVSEVKALLVNFKTLQLRPLIEVSIKPNSNKHIQRKILELLHKDPHNRIWCGMFIVSKEFRQRSGCLG